MHFWDSPFTIPLGAFLVAIVGIIMGTVNKTHAERLRAEQRMAMLAQGIPLADVERALMPQDQQSALATHSSRNPSRAAGFIRLTALLCIFSGLGLMVFFAALAFTMRDHDVLKGIPVGLIPLFVGLGFLIEYRSRVREIARLREEGTL